MITQEKFGNVIVIILLAVIAIIVIPAAIAVSELMSNHEPTIHR